MTHARPVLAAVVFALGVPVAAPAAQSAQGGTRDSLRLPDLIREARAADPRGAERSLQSDQSALKLRNLDAERLPAFSGDGLAQYQSDVAAIPVALPGGLHIPSPKHDTYDAHVGVQENLYDPSRAPRRALEQAQLDESHAQLETSMFARRQEVESAYFAAALQQQRAAELDAALASLGDRLREAAARVREQAALPSDTSAIRAAILQRNQDQVALSADRRAALAQIGQLVGRALDDSAPVALPDLGNEVAQARQAFDTLSARPEFAQFETTRARLDRQKAVVASREQPRLSAFGRLGYGRPGLNPLGTTFDTWWITGVQVSWSPFTWGSTQRDKESIALQQRMLTTEERAFRDALRRTVQGDLATLDRMDSTLALDDRIIALREGIERETRLRFQEGVVTASEYLDRNTDVLTARLARARHRVELSQARARFLTTLGLEMR